MKTKKMNLEIFASMLFFVACIASTTSFAQSKDMAKMKDCCMMKDGKMMCMKDGKPMPMEKDMTMKDGTICMVNGECIMKDGKKMQMKEGQCMDMSGKMDNCSMMHENMKSSEHKKSHHKHMAMTYTCTMHPEVTSDKQGKCPKCGMDLVEKK